MPVFTDSPTAPTQPKPDVIRAFKPEFRTAVIDTRYTPQSDLLAYIEGSSWPVDYYSQVLDANNELNGQDPSLPAVNQQYRRIWSMELKVMQDLSQVAQEESTAEMTLQGSANVYPFLVPQVGDMFRAGVADGREGLFKVTKVERRQIFTDTAHVIDYQLIAINDPVRIFDIEEKVVVTYYFVKDFLLNLQNPLLTEADYNASKKLEAYYYDMAQLYFSQYYSREFMTLIIPNQKGATYDHGLTDFVKTVMSSTDDVHVTGIRLLNIGDDGAIGSNNLWTMLDKRDPKLLKFVNTKAGLVGRESFHRSALMAGMRYTGVARVVYPLDPKLNVDYQVSKTIPKPIMEDNIESTMPPYVPPVPPTDGSVGAMSLIKPIDFTSGYVFSEAFYAKTLGSMSLLEKLVWDYLDFKIIAAGDILKLCDDSYDWGPVEKFYYFPIVQLLIRYNLRRL